MKVEVLITSKCTLMDHFVHSLEITGLNSLWSSSCGAAIVDQFCYCKLELVISNYVNWPKERFSKWQLLLWQISHSAQVLFREHCEYCLNVIDTHLDATLHYGDVSRCSIHQRSLSNIIGADSTLGFGLITCPPSFL